MLQVHVSMGVNCKNGKIKGGGSSCASGVSWSWQDVVTYTERVNLVTRHDVNNCR